MHTRVLLVLAAVSMAVTCVGCRPDPGDNAPSTGPVVVYCSVDETFARDILQQFEEGTGIAVRSVFDSEAGKTTGLVHRLIREAQAGKPGADVFWSGELFGVMQLAEVGVLEVYDPETAADLPPKFRDPQRRWTACAVRERVLAFDPNKTPIADVPRRWEDLADSEHAAHTAIANPLFGTTRGHVAAMFALWGPDRARAFLLSLRDNGALILDGNSATVRAVLDGRVKFAVTDSDDVWAARRAGAWLDSRPLDMDDGGTLLVPCSVGLVKRRDSNASARRLVDFLVSGEVERMLARSASRNTPVRERLRTEAGLAYPPSSAIEFAMIYSAMNEADAAVREILIR